MGKDKRTDNKSCEKDQQEKVNRRTLHDEVSDGFIVWDKVNHWLCQWKKRAYSEGKSRQIKNSSIK